MTFPVKQGKYRKGVEFTVKADMPSGPMEHNVKPVMAMPTGKQGIYHASIELQMHGEWALKMDVSSPARDTIIHKMHFGTSKGESGSSGMKNGKHKMK